MDVASGALKSSGRQKVRLLLEGREVPVISAVITSNEGQPTYATVDLVPLQVIKFIKPRTQAHIFVRDSFTFGDDNFYLAFEGEVLGRSLAKRHDGRFVQLVLYDYSNYWDDAKAYMMNPQFLAGNVAPKSIYGEPTPASQVQASAGKLISVASTAQSQMIDYLTKYKDDSGGVDLTKGAAGVISMLAIVNEFYRANYERLRIIDRLMIKSSGLTGKFLKHLKVEDFMSNYAGMHGGMASLRELLTGVMSLIFHQFVSVPFPSFVETTRGSETGYTISQFLFIPDTYLLPPPVCNVIFPNQQTGFEFSDDFRAAPTRYGFRCSFPVVADSATTEATYPIQYYPKPFADFMSKGSQSTTADLNSGFGPSKLLVNGSNTYASLFYGSKKEKAVGTSFAPILRQSDFLSNEESLRGIYYETDILAPSYTALVRSGKVTLVDGKDTSGIVTTSGGKVSESVANDFTGRNDFIKEIGAYMFLKKRYAARKVNASIMFNPYLVPGFSAIFLDDSEAGQSFVAKLNGITHQLTHQGFSSVASLSLARDFDEIDFMSGGTGDPPLPQWFDKNLFGETETSKTLFNKETKFLGPPVPNSPGRAGGTDTVDNDEVTFRNKQVSNPTIFPNLSKFYKPLLGCDSVTKVGPAPKDNKSTQEVLVTTRGVVQRLVKQYKDLATQAARDEFVRAYTKRPVVKMTEAMNFIGAEPTLEASNSGRKTIPDEFAKFVAIQDSKKTGLPGRFDGINGGTPYSDKAILDIRRNVIDLYIQQLQKGRGFRG